ncbi:MAG: PH domain-containing protein [Planctomycetia bacterium]|nr:PH domain-containing protein [Planctomycetia bacterium]
MKAPINREKAEPAKHLSPAGDAEEGLPVRARFLAQSLLMPGEVVILEAKPSLWFVFLSGAPLILLGVAVIVLSLFLSNLGETVRPWGWRLGMTLIAVRLVIGALQWQGQTYVLTDRRVLSQKGVLSIDVSEAPLSVITRTHVAGTPVQRMFGLGTILFSTNSGHTPPRPWDHLGRPEEMHAQIIHAIDRYGRRHQG